MATPLACGSRKALTAGPPKVLGTSLPDVGSFQELPSDTTLLPTLQRLARNWRLTWYFTDRESKPVVSATFSFNFPAFPPRFDSEEAVRLASEGRF